LKGNHNSKGITTLKLTLDNNNLTELILPEGFNSYLNCSNNNLTELILPEGFNRL